MVKPLQQAVKLMQIREDKYVFEHGDVPRKRLVGESILNVGRSYYLNILPSGLTIVEAEAT